MTEPIQVRPKPIMEPIRHLFAYGTLQAGFAPPEVASIVAKLRRLGEGSLHGKLYKLVNYPGAVIDPASAWIIYGTVYELSEDAEVLRQLDAYEGPEYVRIEQLVTLTVGSVVSCWVYHLQGKPAEERFIESGRWTKRHDAV
ncbi:MAG: gamma-glutamylcyclotransferase [Terracidiphilus sp.]